MIPTVIVFEIQRSIQKRNPNGVSNLFVSIITLISGVWILFETVENLKWSHGHSPDNFAIMFFGGLYVFLSIKWLLKKWNGNNK